MSTELAEALGESPDTTPAPETQETQEAPETPEQPEAQETPEPEVQEEPAKPEAKETPMVPLNAVMEERTKRQALEQRLAALESQKPPEPLPDVLEDQEGFARRIISQMDQKLQNERLNMSEAMARSAYGDDVVNAAMAALEQDGTDADRQSITAKSHPWQELVQWHEKRQTMAEMGGNPKAWMEAQREAIRKEVEAEMAAKQVRKDPSLAASPNLGARKGPEFAPTSLDAALKR